VEHRAIARGSDPSDGGVPTKSARGARLASAAAALLLAAAVASYALALGDRPTRLALVLAALGFALVLAALLATWDDGLAAGPGLLTLAYTVSLTEGQQPLDRGAPLVAVGLVALVELGAWSLELRDGGEQSLLGRLPQLGLVFTGSLAASALVLAVGSIRREAGIGLFVLGAAAAAALLALIARPARGALLGRAD
jgi:hypothetical protein